MSAWAPTRASSVSPPVSVARLISDRTGGRGAPGPPASVCDAGPDSGLLSGRIVPPRPGPLTRLVPAGTTTSPGYPSSPDGKAALWCSSHRRHAPRPVRDRRRRGDRGRPRRLDPRPLDPPRGEDGAPLRPPSLVVGGTEVSQSAGALSLLAGLLVPLTAVAVGGGLVAGRVPRLGLAYAGIGGALALGLLLIELYRASTSTIRPGIEVIAGQRVLTSSVDVGPGWVLGVVALGLTVLAGVLGVAAFGRTVMDDAGTLDPVRPALACAAAVLGVGAVLCLVLPAADLPDRIVTDPTTGLQVVVEQEGPQGLLERPGLALLGGLLLAGTVVLCSVLAPSLRPRLAAVRGPPPP